MIGGSAGETSLALMRKRNFDRRTPNKSPQLTPLRGAAELLRWHQMELSVTAKVWNRAALESGGDSPLSL
jgi:hypothetical protein